MKTLKTLAMAAALLLVAAPAQSAEDNLKQASQKLMGSYGQGKLAEMVKAMDAMKKAGLSYQPSLTVPLKGVVECKDPEALRALHGMYWFDQNYAALYGKKQTYLDIQSIIDDQIHKRQKIAAKEPTVAPMNANLVRQYLENPGDAAKRDAMLQAMNKRADEYYKAAASNPEVMHHEIDVLYGMLIEGMYVVFSLAQDEKLGPDMVALFNQQAKDIDRFDVVYHSFKDPVLFKMMHVIERDGLLHTVRDLIIAKKGSLTTEDVKNMLAAIRPVRDGIAKPCK